MKTHIEEAKRLLATNFRKPHGEHLVRYLGASYDDFRKEIWVVSMLFIIGSSVGSLNNQYSGYDITQIREHVDGTDLETLMKNPSLCPSLRSPEERMRMAVGIAKVIQWQKDRRQKGQKTKRQACPENFEGFSQQYCDAAERSP